MEKEKRKKKKEEDVHKKFIYEKKNLSPLVNL
jgi:hypothetical protein